MSILSSIKSAVTKGVSNLKGNLGVIGDSVSRSLSNINKSAAVGSSITAKAKSMDFSTLPGASWSNPSAGNQNLLKDTKGNYSVVSSSPTPQGPQTKSQYLASNPVQGPKTAAQAGYTGSPASTLGLNQKYNPQGIVNVSDTPITTSELSGSNVSPNIGSAPVNTNDVGWDGKSNAMLETDEKINKENKKAEKTDAEKMIEKFTETEPERPKVPDQYQTDLDESRKEKNEIKTRLAMANAELENQLMAIRQTGSQEGVTEGVYGAQEMQIRRQSAMKIMTLTAQYQAAVDNYNTAKEIVSDWVTQENAYLNRYWSWQNNIFDKALNYTTGKERDAVLDARYEKEQAVKKAEGRKKDLLELYKVSATNKDKSTMQYIAGLITQSDDMDDKTYDTMYGNAMNKLNIEDPNAAAYTGTYSQLVSLLGMTADSEKSRTFLQNSVASFIKNNDWDSVYTTITQKTGESLKGAAGTTFQQQVVSYDVLKDLEKAVSDYENAGGNMNLLKGTEDKIQSNIGVLMTDPRYAELAVRLDSAFYQYRQDMTGAAFGAKESRQYESVIPSKNNTMELNKAKFKGAGDYLYSNIKSSIRGQFGSQAVEIMDKAMGSRSSGGDNSGWSKSVTDVVNKYGIKLPSFE